MYASAQPLDFLHLSVRRWAIRKCRGAKLYAPPFGAALGNPEMSGRQTVRATFRCGAGQSGNVGAPNCTRHLSVRRWAIRKCRGAKLYAPPFGAALGNPEMSGRQTVRATFRCGAGQSGNVGAPNCTRHLSVRRWAIRKCRGAKLYAPPFGAALGNPEMSGRQTVRATFRCGAGQSGNVGAPNCTRHLSVRRWAIRKCRGAKLYAPPFGAALGNPEMSGRQTVRATFRCGAGQSGNVGAPNCTRQD